MKKIYFTLLTLLSITSYSQYISTTNSSASYNTNLQHNGQVALGDRPLNNQWFSAALQIGYQNLKNTMINIVNPSGNMQMGIVGGNEYFSVKAKTGDFVMKLQSGSSAIFNYGKQVSSSTLSSDPNVQRYIFNADNNFNILNIYNTGKITMGTDNYDLSGYRLFVKDGIKTEKLKVEVASSNQWADHVFNDDYTLMPLNEVKTFITTNKHLPNIPSAHEIVTEGGIEQGELNAKLLEKIEELTLHLIEQNEKMILQNKKIEGLEKQVQSLTK
ncbi:hypothetical protein [Empedobacter brevis]|uniref:hypothetical protein n=1 Tax=Empedobacter brevis TaxID=247 RepID=UPI00289F36E3|nr:hypothetical protein [Empedobacter brevis]